MKTVVIFTQNLILESIKEQLSKIIVMDGVIFLTTHFLFENERELLDSLFNNCEYKTFADFLTDEEMESCDTDSYKPGIEYQNYLAELRKKKNVIVAEKILSAYAPEYKYILSDDLGIDYNVWKSRGFKQIIGEYYYGNFNLENGINIRSSIKNIVYTNKILKKIYSLLKKNKLVHIPEEVYVGYYSNRKYVFLGKLNRIEYRLNINFKQSEDECTRLNKGKFETKDVCTYMTTWHEHGKCNVPDDEKYEVRWTQDGYLPPNYSHKDYFFKPNNVKYYCWDELGTQLFKNQGLPYEMIPFRKKLYLPKPVFPTKVKSVLVVASGSGDWTALKNRSDDDIMVDAFVQMAKRFPDINFTYRCHPTWVHPLNVGVNSINRVAEYFKWLNLPNLTLSSNIPISKGEDFQLSYSRSSLDEDLKIADIVFGEHSISMIDAAFKGIPFASVNITKRRNFFVGINQLGFKTCDSHNEIADVIKSVTKDEFQNAYLMAVKKYNEMTDIVK